MKRDISSKTTDLESLTKKLEGERAGRIIGLCHGVFDLLHSGHIEHFQECANLVDLLVVSVTTDSNVKKGPGRPINSINHRLTSLAGIEFIDYVVSSDRPSAVEIIKQIEPDYYFKGPDYVSDGVNVDTAGNLSAEEKAVLDVGGKIFFTKSELRSSSSIINAMTEKSDEEKEVINHVKKFMKENPIQSLVEKMKSKRVVIIGEIIFDEYIFTESLGKSGKHPLVAEREVYRKEFYGGIVPLVNTFRSVLDDSHVEVLSIRNSKKLDSQSKFLDDVIIDKKYSDIVKTRYINEKTNTFMYELYQLDDSFISNINEQLLLKKLKSASTDCDLLIALDFGHGLITPVIRDYMCENFDNFALNVQKNAGNKGFSTLSKYKSADLIIINGAELELELKQKGLEVGSAAKIIHKNMGSKIVAITDGANGLVLTNGDQVVRVPTFKVGNIVDRTGAGDALFAVLSLFSLVIDDLIVLGYLGNLAGSVNLSWFANEKSVTIEDIIQMTTYGLK